MNSFDYFSHFQEHKSYILDIFVCLKQERL